FDFGQLAPPMPSAAGGIDLSRALEAARSEGYAAGRAEAEAAAAGAIAETEKALQGAAEALIAERASLVDGAERAAAELALRLAEKIVGASVAASPDLV